eukprot:scaffold47457_cov19-Tisochrysis_lutea.AAC.1
MKSQERDSFLNAAIAHAALTTFPLKPVRRAKRPVIPEVLDLSAGLSFLEPNLMQLQSTNILPCVCFARPISAVALLHEADADAPDAWKRAAYECKPQSINLQLQKRKTRKGHTHPTNPL